MVLVSSYLSLCTVGIMTIILRGTISVLGKLFFIEDMLVLSVLSTSWKLQKRSDFIRAVIITMNVTQQVRIMMII